jgi:hypothetical protein
MAANESLISIMRSFVITHLKDFDSLKVNYDPELRIKVINQLERCYPIFGNVLRRHQLEGVTISSVLFDTSIWLQKRWKVVFESVATHDTTPPQIIEEDSWRKAC